MEYKLTFSYFAAVKLQYLCSLIIEEDTFWNFHVKKNNNAKVEKVFQLEIYS